METTYQFLADYAAEQGGKVYAVGAGFDLLYAPNVPVRHEQMTLVCGLRVSIADTGTKHIQASIIDADGRPVVQTIEGTTTLPQPPAGTEATARLIIRWLNIEFPKYGAYAARLTLDGREVANIPFTLARPPETVR